MTEKDIMTARELATHASDIKHLQDGLLTHTSIVLQTQAG